MPLEAVLFTLLLNLVLLIVGVAATGLFLYITIKIRLIRKKSLLLLHVLVAFDFFTYVCGLLYIGYLLAGWNYVQLNYDPIFVFATGFAGLIHIKGSILILLGIAVDRFIAIYLPSIYASKNHKIYGYIVALIAIVAGIADYVCIWYFSPLKEIPNCAAIGCFLSEGYREFSGIANGSLGILLMILTILLIIKLKKLSLETSPEMNGQDLQKFYKANKVAMCSLFSGMFITVPSIIMLFQVAGLTVFNVIGPFYFTTLMIAGCSNSISLLFMNKELRKGMTAVFKMIPATATTVSSS